MYLPKMYIERHQTHSTQTDWFSLPRQEISCQSVELKFVCKQPPVGRIVGSQLNIAHRTLRPEIISQEAILEAAYPNLDVVEPATATLHAK